MDWIHAMNGSSQLKCATLNDNLNSSTWNMILFWIHSGRQNSSLQFDKPYCGFVIASASAFVPVPSINLLPKGVGPVPWKWMDVNGCFFWDEFPPSFIIGSVTVSCDQSRYSVGGSNSDGRNLLAHYLENSKFRIAKGLDCWPTLNFCAGMGNWSCIFWNTAG